MNSVNSHPIRVFPLFLSILSSIYFVQAQSPPPPDDQYQYARFSPSMAIIIVVLIAALFLMGFFSIYIRRCSNDGPSNRAALSMRRRLAAASPGLDAGILETFPTFAYSTVKGLKIGKGALECAVCLNEFEDEETIRLIPKCDHVFHAECIDAWLENHVTCPVCRSNLVNSSTHSTQRVGEMESGGAVENDQTDTLEGENTSNVSILVRDENFVSVPDQNPVLKRIKSAHPYRPTRSKSVRGPERFRSHSTGHSLVQLGEDTERFTLRLPVDIRKQVISDALLNRSGSTVRFAREGSGRKGYRTGEGSTKGRSFRRIGSLKTPSFLSRAFSVRTQKAATGNAGTSTSDEVPLNNIGPKSDEVGGRPPV